MHFNHGEFPPEPGEEYPDEGGLEGIIHAEVFIFSDILIEEFPPEYVPMDDYLQKELERQEQERSSRMFPERLP